MRVLISKEENMFVGQCLEHDVCAQGSTMDELMERLVLTICMESDERGGTLDDVEPAPAGYHKLWETARRFEGAQNGHQLALAA
jgi:predicted RNase H-like HicB family nuclease